MAALETKELILFRRALHFALLSTRFLNSPSFTLSGSVKFLAVILLHKNLIWKALCKKKQTTPCYLRNNLFEYRELQNKLEDCHLPLQKCHLIFQLDHLKLMYTIILINLLKISLIVNFCIRWSINYVFCDSFSTQNAFWWLRD